ncbi:MAG: hypothetical protein HS107_15205 [Thermoflexaceae bacterium]|nr:hypothetical protein [Thermoflexaceae bacterium]
MGEKEAARAAPGYITEPDIDLDAEEMTAGGGGALPGASAAGESAARATNLNSSKSNVAREGGGEGAAEGAINTSHSNIKNL